MTGKGRRGSVSATVEATRGAERPAECQALCRRPLKPSSPDVMREPLKPPSSFRHLGSLEMSSHCTFFLKKKSIYVEIEDVHTYSKPPKVG